MIYFISPNLVDFVIYSLKSSVRSLDNNKAFRINNIQVIQGHAGGTLFVFPKVALVKKNESKNCERLSASAVLHNDVFFGDYKHTSTLKDIL